MLKKEACNAKGKMGIEERACFHIFPLAFQATSFSGLLGARKHTRRATALRSLRTTT